MNSYQTPLTEELKNNLPKEVYDDVVGFIASVKFIDNLIQPEEVRGFIKDRPVMTYEDENENQVDYEDGRKEIDISNPHILEDMDFFREKAIFFEKNGKYTNIIPNGNPKSDYANFWREEVDRWRYGLVRDDGEWIPGELYFYWNYSPIWLVEKDKKTKGTKKGNRVKKFPKPWLGDYLFYHYVSKAKELGKHGKLLKTRGIGFSFKAGSWSPRNIYCYPGSGNPNFHLASEKGFLAGDKGIWGKVLDTLDWIAEHTPLPRMRLVDGKRSMEIQLGYEDEYGSRKGLLSSIYGISLKDNPDKARGVRGPFIHYEEDGLFPNLEKAWTVNRKAVEDGGVASGFMLAGGTGGVEGASFEGSEKLFYNPNAYNIFGIPNVYDRNSNPQIECSFFWGSYLNRNNCYNENTGEPDIIKALIEICLDRFKIKYSSSDSSTITQRKAEEPITPQEAIMRTEGTVFPVADLKQYFETIYVDKENFLSNHYVGDLLTEANGSIKWKNNSELTPLRRYDLASNDKTGAVEIFEMPKKNGNGIVFRDRYISGIDPVDSDTGKSLYSVFIMDSWTDRVVAEYTGRPKLIKEAYNITIKLLLFYNAQANYESNLKGLFTHFSNRNCLYLLCDTPQILKDMELVKLTGQYGNKAKGTHASAAINKLGRDLQAEWMMSDAYGEEDTWNLHKIRSFGYIEEAIKWNSDGNFDRISSMGMLMILREERKKRTQQAKENKNKKLKQLSEDPFFTKNYTKVKDIDTKRAMDDHSEN
jgi:hypothetical protein